MRRVTLLGLIVCLFHFLDHFEKVLTWKTDIKNPAGWLYKAILEDYAALSPFEEAKQRKKKKDREKAERDYNARVLFTEIYEGFKKIRDQKLVDGFLKLPDDEKSELRTTYLQNPSTPTLIKRHFKKIGKEKLMFQECFLDFLLRRTKLLQDEEDFKTYAEKKGYRLEEDKRGVELLFLIDEKEGAG